MLRAVSGTMTSPTTLVALEVLAACTTRHFHTGAQTIFKGALMGAVEVVELGKFLEVSSLETAWATRLIRTWKMRSFSLGARNIGPTGHLRLRATIRRIPASSLPSS